MGVNKVVFGDVSIMDISDSTVTPETLGKGATAYDKTGEKITGAMESGICGATPDWNASEGEPGHVLNRTHWEETKISSIIERQTVAVFPDAELNGVKAMLKVGETYTIILDGETYECTAWWHAVWGVVVVGNGAFVQANGMGDDVPFSIDLSDEAGEIVAYLSASDGTHTIEVNGVSTKVHAIDSKYLPSAMENPSDRGVINVYEILELCRPSDHLYVNVGETTYGELRNLLNHAINPIAHEGVTYTGLSTVVGNHFISGKNTGYVNIVALDSDAIPCKIAIASESISSLDNNDLDNAKVATVTVTYPLGRSQ